MPESMRDLYKKKSSMFIIIKKQSADRVETGTT